jgi:hypothetical protein
MGVQQGQFYPNSSRFRCKVFIPPYDSNHEFPLEELLYGGFQETARILHSAGTQV